MPGKIGKIAQSLPFIERNLSIKFQSKSSSRSHGKKCQTLTQIGYLVRCDVMSHGTSHVVTKKSQAIQLLGSRNAANKPWIDFIYDLWLVSNQTPTTSANFWKISAHLAHFWPQMLHILGPKIWLHQFLVGKTSEVCFSTYFANWNKNLKKSWP